MKLNFAGIDPNFRKASVWTSIEIITDRFKRQEDYKKYFTLSKQFSNKEKSLLNDMYNNVKEGRITWEEFAGSKLYKQISESEEVEKYAAKSNQFLKNCRESFNDNKDLINDYIINQLKLENLEMPPVDVFISAIGGRYENEEKLIKCGVHARAEKDPVYYCRTLFHEWFHAVEHKHNLEKGDTTYAKWEPTHAALELADVYLYKKVLGGKLNIEDGHKALDEYRNQIKPHFNQFIQGKGTAKNFLEFRSQMIKQFQITKQNTHTN